MLTTAEWVAVGLYAAPGPLQAHTLRIPQIQAVLEKSNIDYGPANSDPVGRKHVPNPSFSRG